MTGNTKRRKLEKLLQKHTEEKEKIIPKSIDIDNASKATESRRSTVMTLSLSNSTKVVERNNIERDLSNGENFPGTMRDKVMEVITSSDKIAEQTRLATDNIATLKEDISSERSYTSRVTTFPFLSHTLITYILQSYFHNYAVDSNMKPLKQYFSILTLLLLPHDSNGELSIFVNSSRDIKVEQMFEQPSEKKSGNQKVSF